MLVINSNLRRVLEESKRAASEGIMRRREGTG